MTVTLGFTPAMNEAGMEALHRCYRDQLGPVETVQAVFRAMHEVMAVRPHPDVVVGMTGTEMGNWRSKRE